MSRDVAGSLVPRAVAYIAREDVEQVLPDSLGWVWTRNHRYSMWVRMAPVWSRPPWVIVVNPGIPIATCFPPATRNFVGLSNLDTDEYIYVRSAPRSPAWLRMLRDHIDVAVDRARTLTAGHLVAFADQSALWEEWADRPLDDATYAAMETATA